MYTSQDVFTRRGFHYVPLSSGVRCIKVPSIVLRWRTSLVNAGGRGWFPSRFVAQVDTRTYLRAYRRTTKNPGAKRNRNFLNMFLDGYLSGRRDTLLPPQKIPHWFNGRIRQASGETTPRQPRLFNGNSISRSSRGNSSLSKVFAF